MVNALIIGEKIFTLNAISLLMGIRLKNLPTNNPIPNKMFIIVGLIYIKIGLSKYIVNPPNKVISIPPSKGTIGIFFSKNQTITRAIIVATINGGIATVKFFSLL